MKDEGTEETIQFALGDLVEFWWLLREGHWLGIIVSLIDPGCETIPYDRKRSNTHNCQAEKSKPMLMIFTPGGPDLDAGWIRIASGKNNFRIVSRGPV